MFQVLRHRELAHKIAALTEDIEELKSERALQLHQLGCLDTRGIAIVKQRVTAMEVSLRKIAQQESTYADDLDSALSQFNEQYRQAEGVDSAELQAARQTIRPEKEQEAAKRLQAVYGKRFDTRTLAQSQKDVAGLLGEAVEPVLIREKLQRTHAYQKSENVHKTSSQER